VAMTNSEATVAHACVSDIGECFAYDGLGRGDVAS
jgi:hypothetical protein